jgi:hypothetical protein
MGNPHMAGGPHGAPPPEWTAWPDPSAAAGPPPGPPRQFPDSGDPHTAPLPRVGGGPSSGARRIAAILALVGGLLTVVAFLFLALVSFQGLVSVTGAQAAAEVSSDFRVALLWLIPVGAAVAAAIGGWLLWTTPHPRIDRTGFTVVLVAAAVVALLYIGGFVYLHSQLSGLGASAFDVAGIGFWLGLLGVVIAIVGAIIGLATAGSAQGAGPAPSVGPAPVLVALAAVVLVGGVGGATAMLTRASSGLTPAGLPGAGGLPGAPLPSFPGARLPGGALPPGVPTVPPGAPAGVPTVPPSGSPGSPGAQGSPGAPGGPGTPGAAPGQAGGRSLVTSASAACVSPPSKDAAGAAVNFEPANMVDGKVETAWRCDGDGVGQVVELRLAGPTVVNSIAVIPGYAKSDPSDNTDRYLQNRRITAVRYEFDDGKSVVHTLDPNATRRTPQLLAVNGVRTSTIRMVIVSSEPGSESNGNAAVDKVAISEVVVS